MTLAPNRATAFLVLSLNACVPMIACMCTPRTVSDAKKSADFVFRGTLTRIDYVDPPSRTGGRFLAMIEVSAVWKGAVGATVVLHTQQPAGGSCSGFWTQVGTEVLVFARRTHIGRFRPTSGPDWRAQVPRGQVIISPGTCTLTSEITYAGETLKKLGPPKPPQSDR